MGIPQYVEIRYSDNARYRISVSFIYTHYVRNTKDNPPKTKDQFISNPQEVLDYTVQNIPWGEASMSAIAIEHDVLPDYNSEFKNPNNSKIIYEIEKKPKAELLTQLIKPSTEKLIETQAISGLKAFTEEQIPKEIIKEANKKYAFIGNTNPNLPTEELPKARVVDVQKKKIIKKKATLKDKKRK